MRTKITREELRASYFASARSYYELYVDLLMQYHKQRPREGFDAAALEASERARARNLLELLTEAHADIRQGVAPELLDRERALQQLLNAKAERQMRLLGGKHTEEQAKAAAKEIEAITSEYQEVQAQIRLTSPRYASLTQPASLSLKEIQSQVLDPDTLILEYSLGNERSFLWAVTPTSVDSYELPKRAEVEALARRVYDSLTVRNRRRPGETTQQWLARLSQAEADFAEFAARLSRMLLGPVASLLESKRLLVVGDGALQYVPFAALPEPAVVGGSDSGQPLIVKHEVVNLPSASSLAVLRRETANRQPAPKAVAVLADPVFDRADPRVKTPGGSRQPSRRRGSALLPGDIERAVRGVSPDNNRGTLSRLPFTREEAQTIMAAVPAGQAMMRVDFDASLAAAKSAELSQYRIVHFATHGLLNTEHPMLSGIVLSLVNERAETQDGFLRLHEIYNLDLPAELVVLSAWSNRAR